MYHKLLVVTSLASRCDSSLCMENSIKLFPCISNVWKCTPPRGKLQPWQIGISISAVINSLDFTCKGLEVTQILLSEGKQLFPSCVTKIA